MADVVTLLTDIGIELWDSFLQLVPGIVAALVVLLVGFIIGKIIGNLVRFTLEKLQLLDFLKKKLEIQKVVGRLDIPHLLGAIVQWYIFVLFLAPAAELVMLPGLSAFLLKLSFWIPSLIAAVIILLAGIIAAQYVSKTIEDTKSAGAELVAMAAKIVIVVMAVLMAVKQTGVDVSLAEDSFLIILAGFMLAFGLAFGKGGEAEASSMIQKVKKHL